MYQAKLVFISRFGILLSTLIAIQGYANNHEPFECDSPLDLYTPRVHIEGFFEGGPVNHQAYVSAAVTITQPTGEVSSTRLDGQAADFAPPSTIEWDVDTDFDFDSNQPPSYYNGFPINCTRNLNPGGGMGGVH